MYIAMKASLVLVLSAVVAIASSSSAFADSSGRTLIRGLDYIEIQGGKPLHPADGKVVVEEFFNYACPICDDFEPLFAPWAANLPSWVKVVYIPAAFRPDFVPYAQAFYAAKALGLVSKTHEAVYNAIHETHKLPGEGMRADDKAIADFYSNYGISAAKFLATMHSAAVTRQIKEATRHLQKSKVRGTPSLLINGRYLVRGRNFPDMLWIAHALIEKVHKRMLSSHLQGK